MKTQYCNATIDNSKILNKLGYESPKDFGIDTEFPFLELREKDKYNDKKVFMGMNYVGEIGFSRGSENEEDEFLSYEDLKNKLKG